MGFLFVGNYDRPVNQSTNRRSHKKITAKLHKAYRKDYVQSVQEKLCFFFKIHCNPSLAYIAVRDLSSSQRSASLQSLLLAGNFLYNSSQALARDRGQTLENSWKKTTQYLMKTLYE